MKLSTANDETDGSDAVVLLLKPHLVEKKNTHTLFYTLHCCDVCHSEALNTATEAHKSIINRLQTGPFAVHLRRF